MFRIPADRAPMCLEGEETYAGDPNTPAQARRFCAHQLALAFGDAPAASVLVDDVELVVSELVTNAVKAGPSDVTLAVDVHRDLVRLTVTDSAPGVAQVRDPRPAAESGRGLLIVSRLARAWGVEYLDRGKRIWAELTVPSSLAPAVDCSRRLANGRPLLPAGARP